jgi:AcrR family transcriptional regulator
MRKRVSDISTLRREQIIEAAVAVIAEKGLHNLSLSAIEKKARMSRGQLTYYYPAKEDILLGVFDYFVRLMHQRVGAPAGTHHNGTPCDATSWEWVQHLLAKMLTAPPVSPEFSCLQYTFLAQLGQREDFRQRLASLYEEWRGNMAGGMTRELGRGGRKPAASPRTLASLVQALLHGLSMQLAADPNAFDREEMLHLCLDMLSNTLPVNRPRRRPSPGKAAVPNSGQGPARPIPSRG